MCGPSIYFHTNFIIVWLMVWLFANMCEQFVKKCCWCSADELFGWSTRLSGVYR